MNALRDSVEDSCHENGYEVKKIVHPLSCHSNKQNFRMTLS